MQPGNKRIHLDFLDGIRGLSALYVLLFHVVVDGNEELTWEHSFLNLFRFGHEAVVIFIVLSGFVLTLPVVRSHQVELSGGISNFIRRRAKRILPGYYAALFLLPIYLFMVEILKRFVGEATNWVRLRDLFLSGDMLSHLFLIHNISSKWEGSINPVLWSMGTEWWIYFIFALILIPLWRKFGMTVAFVASLLLGLIPALLLMLDLPTLYGFPHLLMGFGLGMLSAAIIYSKNYEKSPRTWDIGLMITIVASFLAFCLVLIIEPSVRSDLRTRFITDLLLAVVCSGLIIKMSLMEVFALTGSKALLNIKKILEFKPIKILGEISYSLYLTHLVVWNMIGITLGLSPVKAIINLSLDSMLMRLLVLIPILLIFAYVFYRMFEKPFLHQRVEKG